MCGDVAGVAALTFKPADLDFLPFGPKTNPRTEYLKFIISNKLGDLRFNRFQLIIIIKR